MHMLVDIYMKIISFYKLAVGISSIKRFSHGLDVYTQLYSSTNETESNIVDKKSDESFIFP